MESTEIDVTFDFRSDTPPHKDPDRLSPRLRKYHQLLWSKPLPSGAMFELSDTTPGAYLHHRSELGEFWLASDAVIPDFKRQARLAHVVEQIPEAVSTFVGISYTIGGMMVFPGNRIGGRMTINGARGCHPRIKDRFDLTVEWGGELRRQAPAPRQPERAHTRLPLDNPPRRHAVDSAMTRR